MPLFRSLPFMLFVSLLCAAALTWLCLALLPPGQRGGYAVLVCGSDVPDRTIREQLAGQGLGKTVVSESSQWVFIDNFNAVEQFPLDEYHNRIAPFDPRNDGYAEHLLSFFVRGEKRFLFIPRAGGGNIEKRVAAALPDIPHSLEFLGYRPALWFLFPVFGLAVLGLFALRFLKPRSLPPLRFLVPCLPPLAALAPGGGWGFALGALLVGLLAVLHEPCLELFASLRRRAGGRKHPAVAAYDFFKLRLLLAPLFVICYALVAVFSGFNLLLAAAVFSAVGGLFVFSQWSFFRQGAELGHTRFMPLPILKQMPRVDFLWALLPFALAAALSLLVSPLLHGSAAPSPALFAGEDLVTEAEYFAHADFQAKFSRRPLDSRPVPPEASPYPSYVPGDDGLPLPAPPDFSTNLDTGQGAGIPPFPLKDLMRFLMNARR